MTTKDQYVAFVEAANMYAEDVYCLPAHDVMGRDIDLTDIEYYDPEGLIDYYAEKYDLTPRERQKQLWGTSRVHITTYEPVVENFAAEGDEYRVEHPEDMWSNRFNPYWCMDD